MLAVARGCPTHGEGEDAVLDMGNSVDRRVGSGHRERMAIPGMARRPAPLVRRSRRKAQADEELGAWLVALLIMIVGAFVFVAAGGLR